MPCHGKYFEDSTIPERIVETTILGETGFYACADDSFAKKAIVNGHNKMLRLIFVLNQVRLIEVV
jgi:hypothetical protein